MLEKIGTAGFETISASNSNAAAIVRMLTDSGIKSPVVAELGVGIGATTLSLARALDHNGTLHVFDFDHVVIDLCNDLAELGFANVVGHGNTERYWDSYNWTLANIIIRGNQEIYDYIYIDGAHTFAVDGLAFVLCDKLLKPGGYIEFDDYWWTFAGSKWMKDVRELFMTDEQIRTPQVRMVVDLFLSNNPNYEMVADRRVYRKISSHLPSSAGAPPHIQV